MPDSPERLSTDHELSLLQMEYGRMAAEIQMYIKEEYSPKLAVFGTVVVGAIAFALGNDRYNFVYPIIPYFLLALIAVTSSEAYIITCLAERVRQIERRVAELNGHVPILIWESKMTIKLMYPLRINIPRKDNTLKSFKAINPIFFAVVLMIIPIIPIVGFCFYMIWKITPPAFIPWYYTFLPYYYILTIDLFVLVIWSSTLFFRIGAIADSLNWPH
jgi:hypothetical protein